MRSRTSLLAMFLTLLFLALPRPSPAASNLIYEAKNANGKTAENIKVFTDRDPSAQFRPFAIAVVGETKSFTYAGVMYRVFPVITLGVGVGVSQQKEKWSGLVGLRADFKHPRYDGFAVYELDRWLWYYRGQVRRTFENGLRYGVATESDYGVGITLGWAFGNPSRPSVEIAVNHYQGSRKKQTPTIVVATYRF